MSEPMMGAETEYAVTALDRTGNTMPRNHTVQELMTLARRMYPHLPGMQNSRIYLQNGGVLYIDCGCHPEYGTAECVNPTQVVRQILAGEIILTHLMTELVRTQPTIAEALCFKCNVDYSGTSSTWGCHESYLHSANPSAIPPQLTGHLVSRIVYTGAGGFNSLAPGIHFMISPRVAHMSREISQSSTHDRGIYHTKDEPLCGGGHHRLHLLTGESLHSRIAMWLRCASTALIVALIQARIDFGDAVRLRSPLGAMRAIASDPTCKVEVECVDGVSRSALAIQRRYLEVIERNLTASSMPSWAGDACRRWRDMLEQLEGAPDSVSATLDWAIKHALFNRFSAAQGYSLNLAPSTANPTTTRSDLRDRLYEIDTRFGQLGQDGIFTALDRAGVLDHDPIGIDGVERAVEEPPVGSRAKLRGDIIRRNAHRAQDFVCEWSYIWDLEAGKCLKLDDPFQTREVWEERQHPIRLHQLERSRTIPTAIRRRRAPTR